jgi:hypothetical protein
MALMQTSAKHWIELKQESFGMNREMLMLVDAISREKNVERDVVFGAVELALASGDQEAVFRAMSTFACRGRSRQRQL